MIPRLRSTLHQTNTLVKVFTRGNSGIFTSYGGIKPKPLVRPYGSARVVTIWIPFLLLGGSMAKRSAELLMEWDIFIQPEDEDDDNIPDDW